MQIEKLALPGLLLITPRRLEDPRGFFSETYRHGTPEANFVQDNHSLSRPQGVVRGLHCQIGPNAQGKLVRCIAGAIWDVAVDIRQNSPSYGRHCGVTLSAGNWRQLWIPPGFLHGFATLAPNTEVIYKVTAPYDRDAERGVLWNDPSLALPWPVAAGDAILSDKDLALPDFSAAAGWFPA